MKIALTQTGKRGIVCWCFVKKHINSHVHWHQIDGEKAIHVSSRELNVSRVEKIGKSRQPLVIFQFPFFFGQSTIKNREPNIVASQYNCSLVLL